MTARAARAFEEPPSGPIALPDSPSPAALRVVAEAQDAVRRCILETAIANLGRRAPGLDCSRLMQECYAAAGIALPRNARAQWSGGQARPLAALRPGDLVFFAFRRRPVDHVGLYTGEGAFVHVSSSAGCVQLARLDAPEFARAHVASRAWLGDDAADAPAPVASPTPGGAP